MFLIFGISSKQKELDQLSPFYCQSCKQEGTIKILLEYMVFSLFFIPIIKWNKRYYGVTTCCQSFYQLDQSIGRKIEKGEDVDISESDLDLIYKGQICPNCGYSLQEEFQYCPKCAYKI